jgi:hypothetical protein
MSVELANRNFSTKILPFRPGFGNGNFFHFQGEGGNFFVVSTIKWSQEVRFYSLRAVLLNIGY